MVGLIVAVSIIGTVLVASIVLGAIRIAELEETVSNLCECFLRYRDNPESVTIVEDYTSLSKNKSDFNFPNSEGFDK